MAILDTIGIGDKLEVGKIRGNAKDLEEKSTGITSQVMDIQGDIVHISKPMKYGKNYALEINEQIHIYFFTKDKGILKVRGEVLLSKDEPILIYGIKLRGKAKKIQRRFYFRLDITMDIAVTDIQNNRKIPCVTKDISGGGLKCITREAFQSRDPVEVNMVIDQAPISVLGEIVRCIKDPVENNHEVGIQFTSISDKDRNTIVSYIFQKQRELRKKGLI
ncbi:flagellar brake protein [Isachenkonia alkalipeptolytica]|uniref:Pilus assembly protein PilZ n=1 Tax=Isachenkonia alkalipeptolytica TaxID=2565777 RepID=A0AA43XIW7_9CLOT|nr:PilZ domain-containing protein [Isachenkonia alkalipeptolytica]NBG87587.1 hypothetical protein [Isachenkonia alkalipeptolytica]